MTDILNIYCDGGSRGNPGPAASAFVVMDSQGNQVFQSGFFLGIATNNQAEYHAVLNAVNWLVDAGKKNSFIFFYLDSLLVVNQMQGVYKIKDLSLKELYLQITHIISKNNLHLVGINHIPRSQNYRADLVVNQTLDNSSG